MRLKAYLYDNIGSRNLKGKVSFCKGENTFSSRLVENSGSVLKSMSFLDQDA